MAEMAERDGGRLDPNQLGVSRQVGRRVRRHEAAKPINKPQAAKAPSDKKIEAAIALFTKKLAAKEALAKTGKTVDPYTGKPIATRIESFRRKLAALMAQAKPTEGATTTAAAPRVSRPPRRAGSSSDGAAPRARHLRGL